MMTQKAIDILYNYLNSVYSKKEFTMLWNEVLKITSSKAHTVKDKTGFSLQYNEIQFELSRLNEKSSKQKNQGVYYTPSDVASFILSSTIKAYLGKLSTRNISSPLEYSPAVKEFCLEKNFFDPTCGAGEFLLIALNMKLDILGKDKSTLDNATIHKIVSSIKGNDIDEVSILICKLRMFLCILERGGVNACCGISKLLNASFYKYDFVTQFGNIAEKFDIVVGNPPYVEDAKSELNMTHRYGNIYANVLENSIALLETGGAIGFVIPLSYVSTSRMANVRSIVHNNMNQQYILSYADRPDCLFDGVHQKLNILIASQSEKKSSIYTGNYQYWYSTERDELFDNIAIVRNDFATVFCIPKLGTQHDLSIYKKIINPKKMLSLYEMSRTGSEKVFLNRRETFWMKAYRTTVEDPEYKVFSFATAADADFCYCLLNSTLFWWYWICTSDCWHVTKDLNGFMIPNHVNIAGASKLATALMQKLESTKVYVGTKQVEYEYKHRACLTEIHEIDDFVNKLFGLSECENEYIKNFALRYRTSRGALVK